jgi:DNA-directed RNA polymerase subunit RPC12/RpoP
MLRAKHYDIAERRQAQRKLRDLLKLVLWCPRCSRSFRMTKNEMQCACPSCGATAFEREVMLKRGGAWRREGKVRVFPSVDKTGELFSG